MTYTELIAAKDAAYQEYLYFYFCDKWNSLAWAALYNLNWWQQLVDNFKGKR